MSSGVPVLLVVYRRPELTRCAMAALEVSRPRELFVAADSPNSEEDVRLCDEVKRIALQPAWECDLRVDVAVRHMGSWERVTSAVGWVLRERDAVVVVEDDCIVTPDFLPACNWLLDEYADSNQVLHISGCSIIQPWHRSRGDYLWTRHALPPWGWATWRRAWFRSWADSIEPPELEEAVRRAGIADVPTWTELIIKNRVARWSWDLEWNLRIWAQDGWSLLVRENLVRNLGYGEAATLTRLSSSRYSALPTGKLPVPMRRPRIPPGGMDRVIERSVVDLMAEVGAFGGH